MKKMKLLVTGGAGYIGSHVLNLLGKLGHELVVVDNLSTGRKASLLYGKHECIGLEETAKIDQLMQAFQFDGVLHFAGSIIVPESVENPLLYYSNNTQNSLNLIKLCIKNSIKKFIFSSTAAVYGIPATGLCVEETPTAPINPYGRSKLMTEWMLEDTANAHDFSYVALRYFNVAGANGEGLIGQCSPISTHLIKIACEVVTGKRKAMKIFGDDYETPDGTNIRDYIHVDDLAQAHVDALGFLSERGESTVVNCGYGHGHSVREVLAAVKKISKLDFSAEVTGRRPGDAPSLVARCEKIKQTLGWKPRFDDLEYIVKTAIDWEKKMDNIK